MILTQIHQQEKNKWFYDCFIDGEFLFTLNQSELKGLQLSAGMEISHELLEDIYDNYILKRAKKKALSLLERKDRTKQEIQKKLKDARFNDYIIHVVITFLEKYQFIDDKEYIKKYLSYHKNRKSLKQIQYELKSKGIGKDDLSMLNDLYTSESETAFRLLNKKYARRIETKEKMMAFLIRKGFKYDDVKKVVNQWIESSEKVSE